MAAKQLNAQQAAFARYLAQGKGKAESYRLAYPGDYSAQAASVKGYRLAKHPLIAGLAAQRAAAVVAAVDSAVERYGITADRIADAIARLAFTDLDQICSWGTAMEGGKRRPWLQLHDSATIAADARPAIAEIRRSAAGELSVKLFNKREALMDLARLKGWIADKPIDQRSLVMLKIER